MVKIQDPTRDFEAVVRDRRASRALKDAERFRLGLHGLDCGTVAASDTREVLVGASAWALKAERVERTVGLIGHIGGLMVDMGFRVCPIGADAARSVPPALVVWVCGDETLADEYEQLEKIGAPGISIGSCVDGLDAWDFIDSDLVEDPDQLDHELRPMIEGLVGQSSDTADVTERLPDLSPDQVETSGTGRDETEPPKSDTPTGARPGGTRRHQPGRGSSIS